MSPTETRVPLVVIEGTTWFVCPVAGYDCARVAEQPWGVASALDVIAVHVALHHRLWR